MLQIQPELLLSTRLQVSVYGSVCVFLHATLPKHQGILDSTTFSYAQLFNTPDELPKFSQRRLPWGLP